MEKNEEFLPFWKQEKETPKIENLEMIENEIDIKRKTSSFIAPEYAKYSTNFTTSAPREQAYKWNIGNL